MRSLITFLFLTYFNIQVKSNRNNDVSKYPNCTAKQLCSNDFNRNKTCGVGVDDHEKHRVFENECEMMIENCRIADRGFVFHMVPLGTCKELEEFHKKRQILKYPSAPKPIYKSKYPQFKFNRNDYGSKYVNCTAKQQCWNDFNRNKICGVDGHGKHRVFENECEMMKENCRIETDRGFVFMYVPLDLCQDLSKKTPLLNYPAAPKFIDVTKYPNLKTNRDAYLSKYGHCAANNLCNHSFSFHKMCGVDGHGKRRKFENECEMEKENCRIKIDGESEFKSASLNICQPIEYTQKPIIRKPIIRKPIIRKPIIRKSRPRKPTTQKPVIRRPRTRKPIEGCPNDGTPICGYNGHGKYKFFPNFCHFEDNNRIEGPELYSIAPLYLCRDEYANIL